MTALAPHDQVVVVGAGHAGVAVVAALRAAGCPADITLVGDEPTLPYERPPLSKAYLTGRDAAIELRPAGWYGDNGIELVVGRAVSLDRPGRAVLLDDGRRVGYDHLVLATGTEPRPLSIPGCDLGGVLRLRTRADADRLREALGRTRRAVVLGAGFIGLEFAAAAAAAGVHTTVLEAADRVMARVVTPQVSAAFTDHHRSLGVDVRLGVRVAALRGHLGRVTGVQLEDGEVLPTDLVLLGVGVLPACELARAAGLAVEDGIIVDRALLTEDPAISAAGDCASAPGAGGGRRLRLESVQNATDHARRIAARLVGTPVSDDAVPWFWSEQGSRKLTIAGLGAGHDDTVVVGDPAVGRFSVLCFRGSELLAVESVNSAADHLAARRLLADSARPTPAEAATPGFQLKRYAAEAKL